VTLLNNTFEIFFYEKKLHVSVYLLKKKVDFVIYNSEENQKNLSGQDFWDTRLFCIYNFYQNIER